mgnify:CR=1 FL=1
MAGYEKLNEWRRNNLKSATIYLNMNNDVDKKFIEIFRSVDSKSRLVKAAIAFFLKHHPAYLEEHKKGGYDYFKESEELL